MSLTKTFATAGRVLKQLRHDPRTIGLIMVVPPVLIALLKYVFDGKTQIFNSIAPLVLGIFPLIVMFVVTSVAMLRERTSGTLERLMTLPVGKLDILLGYGIAFAILALIQALIASGVVLGLLGAVVAGGTLQVIITAVLAGLLGTSLGLFASAFARSEFQAVQFMPAFILPQLLICGFFVARDQMVQWLQWLSDILPMTYIIDGMRKVTTTNSWGGDYARDLIVTGGFIIFFLILGAITLRRHEA